MTAPREILVTSALPYANGPIHLGHLVEYIQTDIWVRAQRLRGATCYYVCADDTHGTPVMLRAEQEGIAPEELIARMHAEHTRDFAAFEVGFDHYHSTHSDENRTLCTRIYRALQAGKHIAVRTIEQAYDPIKQMFLPDRFIRGTCPRCGTPDQYGDACEACGATYAPTDLKDAVSALSGARPELRQSEHYFFRLGDFQDFLRGWLASGRDVQPVQQEVVNKLDEWFAAGLKDWDISRDAPYFGFEIPDAPGKYFYVWLDAPVGYFASFQHLCARLGLDFERWLAPDTTTELYHFIGKDILYFHTLFWPAMLKGAGLRLPNAVYAHGFLTIDGQKMSKSRGTFIKAETYLRHFDPEYLRYYFAAKLSSRIEDLDLNLQDFANRVNSNLVGKYVNIASRCASLLHKCCDGQLASQLTAYELLEEFQAAAAPLAALYEAREYAEAVRRIMALADLANAYVDREKPWQLAQRADAQDALRQVCSVALNLFRLLTLYLKPILPRTAARVEQFLDIPPLVWDDAARFLIGHRIRPYEHLLKRIEPRQLSVLMADARAEAEKSAPPKPAPALDPVLPTVSFEDFSKIDLRVVEIRSARRVEGADKLLELTVDLGGEQRTVFAGIREAYEPAALVGRQAVLVANLAPRKLRFGVSEGMLLAAGPGKKDIFLLQPDAGAAPGMRVR